MLAMSDPILLRIAEESPDELDACVRAIIALGSDAASAIATQNFLSEDVMRDLAEHDSSDVRSALARNHSCPPRFLIQLAADPDEWVRFHAVRNPEATEEAEAAFALTSSPDEVARAKHRSDDISPEDDPATHPEVLRRIAEEELAKEPVHRNLHLTSSLGANPALPQDLVERLIEAARDRWEWRSLWGRGDWIWPSTYPFLTEGAPDWLMTLLSRHGHPAALLHRGIATGPSPDDPAAALRNLVNSELLVRALWRELALAGVVRLVYWNDSHEGDKFFPQADGLELMDSLSPAQFIIGGYSSSREWITTSDSLWEYAVLRLAASGFEDWFDTQIDEEFDDASLGLFALSGAAWIADMNYAPIQWTQAGQEAVDGPLFDAMAAIADSEDYDTEVTVVASQLPAIGYAETSDDQKAWLTDLIRQSRKDSMVKTWGLADHFLMCIALHPSTPPGIRDSLLSDPSENVRQAAIRGRVEDSSAD